MHSPIDSPKVSVIIPTFNRAHLVSRAVKSVLAQSYHNFELIIIDDGSVDNTQAVIEAFQDPRIRYISLPENRGLNVARNTGINTATGDYIAFLDSDDEWLPTKLEKQIQTVSINDPEVGACYTWLKCIHETTLREKIIPPLYQGYIFEDLLYSCFTNVSSILIKSDYLKKIGGFDSDPRFQTCEDWDLWLRLARNYKFVVVPEALTVYWDHDSSDRLTNKYDQMLNGYTHLISKHPEMRDLVKTFRTIGSASLKQKSDCFFERGKRYMRWSQASAHTEGTRLAKAYFKAAFLAYPFNFSKFTYFLVSVFLEKEYLRFTQIERQLRKWIYQVQKTSLKAS